MNTPQIKLYAATLDCPDPLALANFYAALLGWIVPFSDADFACVSPPGVMQGGYPIIMFQKNAEYAPPVWPEEAGAQQQMAHLDFAVEDVEQAVAHAIACGAKLSPAQFSEHWRVMFDPAGHPFCLCGMKPLMDSEAFALK